MREVGVRAVFVKVHPILGPYMCALDVDLAI